MGPIDPVSKVRYTIYILFWGCEPLGPRRSRCAELIVKAGHVMWNPLAMG